MDRSTEEFLLELRSNGVRVWLEDGELRAGSAGKEADPALVAELRARKPEIVSFLKAIDAKDSADAPALSPRLDGAAPPLSFGQQRLWLINELGKASASPVDTLAIPLLVRGPLDCEALRLSLSAIIQRHEILRTSFKFEKDEVRQVIHPPHDIHLDQFDLGNCGDDERRARSSELLRKARNFVFDLEHGPLFRAHLIRHSNSEHIVVIIVHHIVFDGWSMSILYRELEQFYAGFVNREAPSLPDLPIQYADYAVWQRRSLSGARLEELLHYWRSQLAGLSVLEMYSDHPRPPAQSYNGAAHSVTIDAALVAGLRALSRAHGVSVFTSALGVVALLLYRHSGQDDIAIGTPITDREHPQLQHLMGFFLNTLVVRIKLDGDPTFSALVGRVQKTLLEAFAHKNVPFERLVEELERERDPSRNPLFQVGFAMQGAPESLVLELTGLDIQPISVDGQTTRFDLEIYVWESESGLALNIAYNADLYDPPTIHRLAEQYINLLQNVVEDPNRRLADLSLFGPEHRRVMIEDWNQTRTEYPRDRSIQSLFECRAEQAPHAPALQFGGTTHSYAELEQQANRLAHFLCAQGAGPGVTVAIYANRDANLVVALLAVLKTGGAYLPLDPEYPPARLEFMLDDAGAVLLLTLSTLSVDLPNFTGTILELDRECEAIERCSDSCVAWRGGPDDIAYIIYTSGSSGRPKGVAVTHRGVVSLVCATDYLQVQSNDCVAQASNVSFDAATFEIWGALLNGARLCGLEKHVLLSPVALGEFLRVHGVTIAFVTTALFNLVARENPSAFGSLRALLFGGERVDANAVREILSDTPPTELLHVYGPTEATTFSTCFEIKSLGSGEDNVPIGYPISNSTAYVLDEQQQPVAVGVPGELYLGGEGLAAGYVNAPGLSAEKFVSVPLSEGQVSRLYRTGDKVRFRDDGAIEFIGRIDDQVKIRGFRIEPGEIEVALRALADVEEAVVLAIGDDEDKRLCAWLVATSGKALVIEAVRDALKQQVPRFMVPSIIVQLDSLPLNANGKLDRGALVASPPKSIGIDVVERPRSALEVSIAAVWSEMLDLDEVGVRDNFFDLGGHSLLLVRTHARLRSLHSFDLRLIDLFEHPTIEALARFLRRENSSTTVTDRAAARLAQRRSSQAGEAPPIAIIGMAGRFPGADDVEQFWSNLRDGVESISFFSHEELRKSGIEQSVLDNPDYVAARGYLRDADLFDALFFGYSAREAAIIDPQQRLLLECAAQTIERAGYDPERYEGLIGVYAGASLSGYHLPLHTDPEAREQVGGLTRTLGASRDFVATRLSYKLNLRGPSMDVQTACSTSLVAVHQACRALADYDCDMALAGGVSAITPFKSGYTYVTDGIGSRDGHCRAFDAAANGTVGGSGVAMVMLKRLDDALADGDHVHAVILGTAVNNDGSNKVGYTAPSIDGQAQVIAMAHAAARCPAATIDYVEAHGTGTLLGDPIEIAALAQAFGDDSKRAHACRIGSLKTNVGHLDAAAGVSGLIKAALSLEHRQMVPSLNYQRPNPEIDFGIGLFEVNSELRPWPAKDDSPRRAGVSSFGLGGTNAHAVLEEAPIGAAAEPGRPQQLLCLSARTDKALKTAAANLAQHFEHSPQISLADAAYTLQVGRREFTQRRIVVCSDTVEAAAKLPADNAERENESRCEAGERSIVFMFTGQGAQYTGMGQDLYNGEAVFRDVIDECSERLQPRLDVDLRKLLYPEDDAARAAAESALLRTEFAQPALLATEMALARWWISIGVRPQAMIGHSIGEYAAACVAGVMSLGDALDIVAERGRLMGTMAPGRMLAVPLAAHDVEALIDGTLAIAAVNQPGLCVVAGCISSVSAFESRLHADGVQSQALRTSHAFHSSMMDPVLDEFTHCLRGVELQAPQIPYVSNVSGTWISAAEAQDPSYYARHLRHSVLFSPGLETLFEEPSRVYIELGPGHTLARLCQRHPGYRAEHATISSLPEHDAAVDDVHFLMQAVGRSWLAGCCPDWDALHSPHTRRRVILPTYPLERQRYWLEAGTPESKSKVPRMSADPANWTYVPSWRRVPLTSGSASVVAGNWLCFRDELGLTTQIEEYLRAAGAQVCTVVPGSEFGTSAAGVYMLDPANTDQYGTLLQTLSAQGWAPDFVLHGWSVYAQDSHAEDAAASRLRQTRGFYSLVALARAAIASPTIKTLSVAVLTSQVREVIGDEALCPDVALSAGACRVVGIEHPRLRARELDVVVTPDAEATASLARDLADDLHAAWHDPVVAYRGGYRWVQSFEPLQLPASSARAPTLRDQGVYLISGGLGAIGLELASYLAERAKARLILVSRRGLRARSEWEAHLRDAHAGDAESARMGRIMAMEQAGAEILVIDADVADPAQLRAAIEAGESRFGPLSGVIHAAGAIKQLAPLTRLDREQCETQFQPRTVALRALAEVLADRRLDFVVVNSSLAAVLGVVDFAAYSAAHASMDAFVLRQARSSRTPWLTINWDHWQTDSGANDAPGGFQLPGPQAAALFEQLLTCVGRRQVMVSAGDLSARVRQWHVPTESIQPVREQSVAETGYPRPDLSTEFVEPRTDTECTLARIWRDVLGLDAVGILDNFFELGGDSVLNLQITARAAEAGVHLTQKQIFEYQTIAELVAVAGSAQTIQAEQGEVTGGLPLTPVQHWFFECDTSMPAHFNLPMLVEFRSPLTIDMLRAGLRAVTTQHDLLRARYTQCDGSWIQSIAGADNDVNVSTVDLREYQPPEQDRLIAEHATKLQEALDLTHGPLLRAMLFELGPTRHPRVLLVVHHLVIDVVSWRIVLEDLELACTAFARGAQPTLARKSTSFKQWSHSLTDYAQSPAARSELVYWQSQIAHAVAGPMNDFNRGPNTVAFTQTVRAHLDTEETHALVADVPLAGVATTYELLLAALARALGEWTGQRRIVVDLEGHGRNPVLDGIDVSRTVGWFTTLFPQAFELPETSDPESQLRAIRSQYAAVPRGGIGYGVLRYLHPEENVRAGLAPAVPAAVSFLFLGQFDADESTRRTIRPLAADIGPSRALGGTRAHLIEINAMVEGGCFRISWTYSANHYRRATIERVAAEFMRALRVLLQTIARAADKGGVVDLTAGGLSGSDLAEIMRQHQP